MLLTNRRHRVLFLALAGMEIAWFLPFAMLLIDNWQARLDLAQLTGSQAQHARAMLTALLTLPPAVAFAIFYATMLLYLLAADLLNRNQTESPQRELILATLIVGTTLLNVRLLFYPGAGLADWRWLADLLGALFNLTAGRRPELILMLFNLYLWFRVSVNTDRELSFFSVGLSFRLGMLLAIGGNLLLNLLGNRPTGVVLTYFVLFFVFGLTAVSLARIDEKAVGGHNSRGALLPWSRLLQILATIAVTLGVAGGLARVITPTTLRSVIGWFSPLWNLLGFVLLRILYGFFWLVGPWMERLIDYLRRMLAQSGFLENLTQPMGPLTPADNASTTVDLAGFLERWVILRYCLATGVIVAVLAFIWLFFLRTRERFLRDEEESRTLEAPALDGNLLRQGLERLRALIDLVRRYGVGPRLLAAISVQNIYANVGRLARRRGYPRHPAQAPDEYLPVLVRAFPGLAAGLERITAAYMRVDYGDLPIDEGELEQLRADLLELKEAPPPASAPVAGDTLP